jgi:hypothetical protein
MLLSLFAKKKVLQVVATLLQVRVEETAHIPGDTCTGGEH